MPNADLMHPNLRKIRADAIFNGSFAAYIFRDVGYKSLKAVCEAHGVSYARTYDRIIKDARWTLETAMFTPPHHPRPLTRADEVVVLISNSIRESQDADQTLNEIAGHLLGYRQYLKEQHVQSQP